MSEYENLLLNKDIENNILENDITDEEINNNKNELSEQMNDNFFKYIFENINIQKNQNKTELNKTELNETELKEPELNKTELNKTELNKTELNETELNKTELNKTELKETELNETELNKTEIILDFIKKIYKKIIIKCHPDKGGEQSLFIKCQEYYENKFLIGMLYIGYKIKFVLPMLNNIVIEQILFEIRVIQQKIIYLKLRLKKNINKVYV